MNPKDTAAYISRGVAYNHKGDYDRAIQDFDVAIRLNPKDTVAYEPRGDTYLFQSNLAEAISDWYGWGGGIRIRIGFDVYEPCAWLACACL